MKTAKRKYTRRNLTTGPIVNVPSIPNVPSVDKEPRLNDPDNNQAKEPITIYITINIPQ